MYKHNQQPTTKDGNLCNDGRDTGNRDNSGDKRKRSSSSSSSSTGSGASTEPLFAQQPKQHTLSCKLTKRRGDPKFVARMSDLRAFFTHMLVQPDRRHDKTTDRTQCPSPIGLRTGFSTVANPIVRVLYAGMNMAVLHVEECLHLTKTCICILASLNV